MIAERSLLIVLALMLLMPLVFVVLTALHDHRAGVTGRAVAAPFHPDNFADVFTRAGLLRHLPTR